MTSKRKSSLAKVPLASLCGLALSATIVHAHPILETTDPASDRANGVTHLAEPAPSPKSIKLTFSEGLITKFSGVEVKDERGAKIATGKAEADPADDKRLLVPLAAPLPPGRYTVIWHAVSTDTHRVKGEYTFTIAK